MTRCYTLSQLRREHRERRGEASAVANEAANQAVAKTGRDTDGAELLLWERSSGNPELRNALARLGVSHAVGRIIRPS